MTNLTIRFVCILSLIWSPVMAGAVTVSGGSTSTTTPKTTPDKGVESTPGKTAQPSVKDSADKSGSSNKGAQATQFLTGALMFTMAAEKWGECSSQNYGACAMAAIFTGFGVLSMAQGKEHGKAAGSSGLTSFQSDGLGNAYDYGNIDLTDPNNPLSKDPNVKALGTNTGKLTTGGLLDPKTGIIKTPDGKTYKASDFSSAASMAAAGIPQGAILAAQDAYAQVSKKSADKVEKLKLGSMTATNGFSEGGGGGGGGWGPASPTDDGSGSDYAGTGGSGSSGVSLERDPSSLAGMQKNYNGEPIGVAADSIFLMMTRRYKVKESQESFYTDAELALQK